jgi:hypothetical protein
MDDGTWWGKANTLSPRHVRWAGIENVDQASLKPRTVESERDAAPSLPIQLEDSPLKAATLYRQRRSAVQFDGHTSISTEQFSHMLDALLPGRPTPWALLPWTPRIHPVFFVHRVQGLEPGLYILPRRPGFLDDVKGGMREDFLWTHSHSVPAHIPLVLLQTGDMQNEARAVCCHQDIAADSAFSLGMLAELGDALEEGSWWYRWLHWEAGILGHVLYLESELAGLSSTGIGCFMDDAMHRVLGLSHHRFQTLYHFTVGGPVEDTRLTTEPPYAHLSSR